MLIAGNVFTGADSKKTTHIAEFPFWVVIHDGFNIFLLWQHSQSFHSWSVLSFGYVTEICYKYINIVTDKLNAVIGVSISSRTKPQSKALHPIEDAYLIV